jgi:pyruvate dehydrogenase E2 component (dihydrolipoamide acetyltransferase)
MSTAIAMPKLGMTMQEGTVLEWRLPAGAPVVKGQVLLSIESEKAEIELEAPASGVLRHIYVPAGATVPSGTVLAVLTASADEAFDADAFRPGPASAPAPDPERPGRAGSSAGVAPSGGALRATVFDAVAPITPAARRRARDLGIDPSRVPGSGPGGRVTREDIETYATILAARVRVAEGIALEVATQGEGSPVLLLPGFGTDVSVYARQIPALAAHYKTIAVNPRGVGFSDTGHGEGNEIATAAADVAAIAGGTAVHIVGASLGAAVAIELALAHPRVVRSLALLTPFVTAGARLLAVLDAWCRLGAEASGDTLARALIPWLFSTGFLADDIRRERAVQAFARTVTRAPAATLARAAAGVRAWSGTRTPDLTRITARTLVIAAGEDLLTPAATAVARAIPGATLVVVANAGHAVGLEAPDAVNDALLAHFRAADAATAFAGAAGDVVGRRRGEPTA